jgi:retron-type reverse transcriptase
MAFRCWKVLARSAGEVVRGGKGGRVVASLGSRSVSALEEGRHTLSSSSKFRFQGLIDGIRYTARAASNDALDIVRYLDGAEDEESDEFTEEAPVVENAEEFERFSDSDGDSDGNSTVRPHADGMYRKIIDSIALPESLASAFENLKHKYGKIIFRSQERVDWRWCEQTADELRSGTYTFRPVRLVNVPVLGQTEKMRSVRVVSPKDQIVLEAFRGALEKIYAPLFSPYVHSCKHMALEQVKYGWRGTSWFMELSVEKQRYDETNHKRLKNILSEKIQDKRFLDTLFQMFNAGVIKLENPNVEEGGILSSLLCNIYYQKLDEEVEAIRKEWNTEAKHRSINPAYLKLMVFDKKTLARIGGNAEQMRREKQHRLALARKLAISRRNYKDPNFTRVHYVRFGDNFLVGLSGSKTTGAKIMKRLTTFLQSNLQLQLNAEKTRLSHAVSDKTLFLDAYIRVLDPKEMPAISSSLTRALARKKGQTMRVKQQLEDRWSRECRNVVLKCWSVAFEKWRREFGKDGAKKRTFEAATTQLLSMPEEDSSLWRQKAQDVLHVFISAALRQGLFPQEEVDSYYKVLASLEKSLAKVPQRDFEDSDE